MNNYFKIIRFNKYLIVNIKNVFKKINNKFMIYKILLNKKNKLLLVCDNNNRLILISGVK